MTQQHPITPPPELLQRLCVQADATWRDRLKLAYQAGADAELEACCAFAEDQSWGLVNGPQVADVIRTARRPKPPSLKEQALEILGYPRDVWGQLDVETVRRALEQLPDQTSSFL